MSEVIDLLWAEIEPIAFITREHFERGLAAWDIETVEDDAGRLAFAAMTQGPEFHFASFNTGKAISLAMIRERLAPIMDRFGYVTTRTPIEGANRQHRFNKILGFKEIGQDEFFVTYRMEAPCRS